MVILIQSYSRSAFLMEAFLNKALRALPIDYADVLLLGWHNRRPSQRIIDKALGLKEKGLCRFLGVSGHHRPLFPVLAEEDLFDIFHIRYNAAHRGAEKDIFDKLEEHKSPRGLQSRVRGRKSTHGLRWFLGFDPFSECSRE